MKKYWSGVPVSQLREEEPIPVSIMQSHHLLKYLGRGVVRRIPCSFEAACNPMPKPKAVIMPTVTELREHLRGDTSRQSGSSSRRH